MKIALLVAALFAALAVNGAELNQLTDQEKADGWKLLFDGKDTAGWRAYGRKAPPGPGWVVENGLLHKLPKQKGGDIITEQQFTDYDLYWEWRLAPKANSGVKYLVTEKRTAGPGHEYQMIDDEGAADTAKDLHKTATFYDVLPASADKKLNPVGEWNTSRVLIKGNHIEHWLNGAKVLEYELGSEQVKAAIAKSKFAKAPGFGDKIAGHIMLTDHGDESWFRNVKIRELK